MSAVQLIKPGAVGAEVLDDDAARTFGTAATRLFRIKVERMSMRSDTVMQDVTGDGDAYPTWEWNQLVNAQMFLQGYMASSSYLGFTNMATSMNATSSPIKFYLGAGGEYLMFTGIVHQQNMVWHRRAPTMGLSLAVRMTSTAPSGIYTAA
jgi:hypothetical protein